MVLNSQNLSQELLNDPYYATVENRLTRIGMRPGRVDPGCGSPVCILEVCGEFPRGRRDFLPQFLLDETGCGPLDRQLRKSKPIQRPRPSGRAVIFKYFLRYALIGGTLYAIFRFQFFEARGAILGLLLFVAAVLFECLHLVIKTLLEEWYGRT